MYLVFDVGGTFTKYALLDEGNILEKHKVPTITDKELGVQAFVAQLGEIYDEYRTKAKIDGIAMSLPGQIDVDNGIVYGGGALTYLDKVPLAALLSKRCENVNVALENDAKCAALAEVWLGNGKDYNDVCVLVFGTGIGGGIIKNRRIHRGMHLCAGEMSFVLDDMKREDVDRIIALEKFDELDKAFESLYYLWTSHDSTLGRCYKYSKLKGLPFEKVNGELIYEMAEQGDEETLEFLEDWYFSVAKYCCNMHAVLDPDVILIGGGISAQPLFAEGIKRYVEKMKKIHRVFGDIKIDVCKYRNDSNLLGALFNYKQIYEGLE